MGIDIEYIIYHIPLSIKVPSRYCKISMSHGRPLRAISCDTNSCAPLLITHTRRLCKTPARGFVIKIVFSFLILPSLQLMLIHPFIWFIIQRLEMPYMNNHHHRQSLLINKVNDLAIYLYDLSTAHTYQSHMVVRTKIVVNVKDPLFWIIWNNEVIGALAHVHSYAS